MTRLLSLAALPAMLLALQAPAWSEDFAYPVADAGDARALWGAIMVGLHGPYDGNRRCWVATQQGRQFCMRPHRLDAAAHEGVDRLYVATAGRAVDGQDCHACMGSLALFVLEAREGEYRLAARTPDYHEVGAWGEAPPEDAFAVEPMSRDGHGWVMLDGFTGQGVTMSAAIVFGQIGEEVANLGMIPTGLDTCGYNPDDCVSYAFDVGFSAADGPFHDIVLTPSAGTEPPPGLGSVRVPFDPQAMLYVPPPELEAVLR